MNFPIEAIAGKTVAYEVEATQVKEREVPEINEDFAKAIGAESLEALKENVRGQFDDQQGPHEAADHRQSDSRSSQRRNGYLICLRTYRLQRNPAPGK